MLLVHRRILKKLTLNKNSANRRFSNARLFAFAYPFCSDHWDNALIWRLVFFHLSSLSERSNINDRRSKIRKDSQAEDLASGLLHLGVEKGDRIGIWGPNTYEWVVTQFAAALGGMILVRDQRSNFIILKPIKIWAIFISRCVLLKSCFRGTRKLVHN